MNTYPQQFVNAGIAVIPVQYRDKRPDHRMLPKDDKGEPTWEPYKTQLPSQTELQRWFTFDRNYGVVCGWRNLLVLDFDDANEYSRWRLWAACGKAKFIAESAFQVQSSRGVHVYLRSETPGANKKAGKIDIKYRGYVLGPGSIHPSGAEYRALKPALVLPLITSLGDVLPAEILAQTTLPSYVQTPVAAVVADPWAAAMQGMTAVGKGAVDRIKQVLRIENYFTNTERTSADGRWLVTRCPLHDDHNPSFWIDTDQQLCGCFSGCTPKPLDVIGLHARLFGLSNSDAIRILARQVG